MVNENVWTDGAIPPQLYAIKARYAAGFTVAALTSSPMSAADYIISTSQLTWANRHWEPASSPYSGPHNVTVASSLATAPTRGLHGVWVVNNGTQDVGFISIVKTAAGYTGSPVPGDPNFNTITISGNEVTLVATGGTSTGDFDGIQILFDTGILAGRSSALTTG